MNIFAAVGTVNSLKLGKQTVFHVFGGFHPTTTGPSFSLATSVVS